MSAYEALVVQDICEAADVLRPVYNETHARDGYVSLEVSPRLASDTAGTIAEARRLHAAVNRPNLMIKVPATPAGIAAITAVLTRISITGLVYWFRNQPDPREVTTLARTAIGIVCSIPAIFGLLNAFEVNLAPALTALGVGGIAVSLALKDTLANLFSGFYVSLAGNLRKGDYIRIDGGYEGWVEDIRWRITTIRTLQRNLIVLPNSKLSEAIVTNFSQPVKPLAVPIPIGVSYSTNIDLLDRVVLEEVRKGIGEIEGLLEDPEPVLRFNPGFGDSSLNFTLVVHVAQFEMQFAVTDQIRRRLLKRFREEGINIPFPMRTVEIVSGGKP